MMTASRWVSAIIFASLASSAAAHAQLLTGDSYRSEIFAGSQPENYLRYLQTVGLVPLYPWSSRSFSPGEIDKLIPSDTAHPWRSRFVSDEKTFYGIHYSIVRPTTSVRYNTGFAWGSNDGPIWAGRGLTSAIQAGFTARWGPASLVVAPMAFRAENRAFFILPPLYNDIGPFANATHGGVDLPQRFGNSAYSQLDPGQSTFRIDVPGVAVGVSTANMGWGPGNEYPLLLGNNAAGFPHLFLGTSSPLDIFIGKVQAKLMWGELFQSDYSNVRGESYYTSKAQPGTKRFATGFVIVGQPRGIPGLEVGGARFFHSIWPRSGIPRSYWTKVFQAFLKTHLQPEHKIDDPRFPSTFGNGRGIGDNQLAEVFARWVAPHSGFEISAEYGREDHNEDIRDLLQEPDHSRSYGLAARKVFAFNANSFTAVRFELINFQVPQLVRSPRGEGEIYLHGVIRQGHTNRGQLLGANVGVGAAAGSTLAVDHYTTGGKWTLSWSRDLNQENGNFPLLGVREPRTMDVSHSLGLENTRVISGVDVTSGLTFVHDFNRDFSTDASNINAIVSVRYNLH